MRARPSFVIGALLLTAACQPGVASSGRAGGDDVRLIDGAAPPSDASSSVDAGAPAPDGGAPPPPSGRDGGAPPPRADAGTVEPGTDAGPGADPRCYTERADPTAAIDDAVARYGGGDYKDDLIEILGRRWPAGAALLEAQRDDSYFSTFSDPSSWSGMVGWLDTLVHEETHLFDAYEAGRRGVHQVLFFRDDLIWELPASIDGFPRSEIHPMVEVHADGSYARTYLTGSQGSRGFIALLDEATCYVNEMAALAVLGEHYPGAGVSSRDGSVAFLYFTQLYLRRARTAHPDFYDTLRSMPLVRDIVETQWLRTHYFLRWSDRFDALGIHDGDYRRAMYEPENLAEMERFLGHPVDDSHCLP